MKSECQMCGVTREGCKNYFCSNNPKHTPKTEHNTQMMHRGPGKVGMTALEKMKQKYCY